MEDEIVSFDDFLDKIKEQEPHLTDEQLEELTPILRDIFDLLGSALKEDTDGTS